jgi:hypothetical protein
MLLPNIELLHSTNVYRILGNHYRRRHAPAQDVPLVPLSRIAPHLDRTLGTFLESQIAAKVSHVPPAKAQAHPKSSQGASYLCANNEK